MREMEFDFVIYPLKLIITVGLDYKTLCDRFENMEPEHEGKWGDKEYKNISLRLFVGAFCLSLSKT